MDLPPSQTGAVSPLLTQRDPGLKGLLLQIIRVTTEAITSHLEK